MLASARDQEAFHRLAKVDEVDRRDARGDPRRRGTEITLLGEDPKKSDRVTDVLGGSRGGFLSGENESGG